MAGVRGRQVRYERAHVRVCLLRNLSSVFRGVQTPNQHYVSQIAFGCRLRPTRSLVQEQVGLSSGGCQDEGHEAVTTPSLTAEKQCFAACD